MGVLIINNIFIIMLKLKIMLVCSFGLFKTEVGRDLSSAAIMMSNCKYPIQYNRL